MMSPPATARHARARYAKFRDKIFAILPDMPERDYIACIRSDDDGRGQLAIPFVACRRFHLRS